MSSSEGRGSFHHGLPIALLESALAAELFRGTALRARRLEDPVLLNRELLLRGLDGVDHAPLADERERVSPLNWRERGAALNWRERVSPLVRGPRAD